MKSVATVFDFTGLREAPDLRPMGSPKLAVSIAGSNDRFSIRQPRSDEASQASARISDSNFSDMISRSRGNIFAKRTGAPDCPSGKSPSYARLAGPLANRVSLAPHSAKHPCAAAQQQTQARNSTPLPTLID